jgi:uncharacterized YccA/Bax inhibitor family protein
LWSEATGADGSEADGGAEDAFSSRLGRRTIVRSGRTAAHMEALKAMPNPALNENAWKKATADDEVGWAAKGTGAVDTGATTYHPAIDDGPISPYRTDRMTMGGAMSATGVLFVVLLAFGAAGWAATPTSPVGEVQFPGWLLLPLFGALGVAFLTIFKPHLARFTSFGYAALEGLVLGAISRVYDAQWNGIVVQAVLLTAAVFFGMLLLYSTHIVKVTDRMRRMVIVATFGVFLVYGVSLIASLFGASISFITGASLFSILFSVAIVGLAAFNLMLDFDFIERGANAGLPKQMEWFAAFGLMVTLVWLYLEILRLLSKLRSR